MRRVLLFSLAALLSSLGFAGLRAAADDEKAAPAPAPSAEALVERLASDDFRVREQASRDLAAMGAGARPALEKAMKESESLEVRWRAEQLLRRLDRQGERPLEGGPAPELVQPEAPAPDDRGRGRARGEWADQWRRFEEIERSFEEMRKRMESEWGAWPSPLTPFGFRRQVQAPGLSLDVLPGGRAELHVKREDGDGRALSEETYRGKDLADILAKEPKLAEHPGMAELKRKAQALDTDPGFGLRFGAGTTTITTSSGLEIRQQPGKTTVTIREKGDDGEEKVTTVEGTDLDQIRKDHPELAEKLKGLSFSFGPAVRIFRNRAQRDNLEPLPEARPERPAVPMPPTAPEAETPVFGIRFQAVDPVLASHLGLEVGGGLLLAGIDPSSQAEAIGLLRHDVIVSVNGVPVKDGDATALRQAAKDRSPLTLEVIRGGKRTTLSR